MIELWPGSSDLDEGLSDKISWFHAPPPEGFSSAKGQARPFWSALEALAWIVSGRNSFVDHIGSIERSDLGLPLGPVPALGQLLLLTSIWFCECGSQDTPRYVDEDGDFHGPETFWRDCSCVENAGRRLFDTIYAGDVQAFDGETRALRQASDFLDLDHRNSATDWLRLGWSPKFSSRAIMAELSAPPPSKFSAKDRAEVEKACGEWLETEFQKPENAKQTKRDFQKRALERYSSLSVRKFWEIWSRVAPQFGRSTPGRKS